MREIGKRKKIGERVEREEKMDTSPSPTIAKAQSIWRKKEF
jgi:hypothetical protein